MCSFDSPELWISLHNSDGNIDTLGSVLGLLAWLRSDNIDPDLVLGLFLSIIFSISIFVFFLVTV